MNADKLLQDFRNEPNLKKKITLAILAKRNQLYSIASIMKAELQELKIDRALDNDYSWRMNELETEQRLPESQSHILNALSL